jgi:exopolysaccharide biosynthesis polyprenyl glycosylphosphotransferase
MIFIDLLSYILSIFISFLFYTIPFNQAIIQVNWILITSGGLFFILSIKNYKGYRIIEEFSQLNQISALLKASVLTVIIAVVSLFVLPIEIPSFLTNSSRIAFIISILVMPILMRQLLGRFSLRRDEKENVLIFGAGEIGRTFANHIKGRALNRFQVVGFIDDRFSADSVVKGEPVLGSTKDIETICNEKNIDRIIVAARNVSEEKLILLDQKAHDLNIRINYLPSLESFVGNPGKLKELSGIPLVTRRVQPQTMFYTLGKRAFDIIAASIGFLLTSPVWIVIYLLIRRDSPGSVIFFQERVGLNGKRFKIYKFRSMKEDAPKYANCPTGQNDPRVTNIGKWLRKTSIDELPQLINIIRGDMSLVGPRPEMPFIVDEYNLVEKKRLLVKPGLTGLWQVSPYRNSEINHNLEYDFYYIQNQGFILDFVILVMTVFFVFRGITH